MISRRAGVLAVSAAAVVLTACSSSSGGGGIPSFTAQPGEFRVVPHPTSGAPAPQLLRYKGHQLLADLGQVTGSGDAATAGMSFVLRTTPADTGASVPFHQYKIGDTVAVGTVHVTVDAIYGSGDSDIAVDITLT